MTFALCSLSRGFAAFLSSPNGPDDSPEVSRASSLAGQDVNGWLSVCLWVGRQHSATAKPPPPRVGASTRRRIEAREVTTCLYASRTFFRSRQRQKGANHERLTWGPQGSRAQRCGRTRRLGRASVLGWDIARARTVGRRAQLAGETTDLHARGDRRRLLASMLGNDSARAENVWRAGGMVRDVSGRLRDAS